MTDKWTKEKIYTLLEKNDLAIGRALVRIYENQTFDEQANENTKCRNGEGFRPCHARIGTSMAKFVIKNGFLTPKQADYWRVKDKSGKSRIGIYSSQLLEKIKKG